MCASLVYLCVHIWNLRAPSTTSHYLSPTSSTLQSFRWSLQRVKNFLPEVAFEMLHAVFLCWRSCCCGEKTISFCFSWIIIFVKVFLMNYGHCVRFCMWVCVCVEVGEGNALSEQFSDAKVNLLHSVSCYREHILKSFTIKHLIITEMKWGENYII